MKSVSAHGKLQKYQVIWSFGEKMQPDRMRVANLYGKYENYTALFSYLPYKGDVNTHITPAR